MTDDPATNQRLLNLAGYGPLAVDGISGPITRAATARWQADAAAIRDKFGTLDPRSEANLTALLPELQRAARQLLPKIQAALPPGYTVKIICGTRSFFEQSRLYAKGRTAPGPRVTNAAAGASRHNFGLAFDIGIFTPTGAYCEDDAPYRAAVSGLPLPPRISWGGSWKSFPDTPHFQLDLPGLATMSAIRATALRGRAKNSPI